jgi:hypothetical protein
VKADEAKFIDLLTNAYNELYWVKLVLAKPRNKSSDLKKVVAHQILIKDKYVIQIEAFTKTQSFTSNMELEAAVSNIKSHLEANFLEAYFFTQSKEWILKYSRKGSCKLIEKINVNLQSKVSHDRQKRDWIDNDELLKHLGILNYSGHINKDQGGKYRQINRFVELMSHLILENQQLRHKKTLQVIEVGSGKGYLSFALYNYLKNHLDRKVDYTGIELRSDLVEKCNELSTILEFNGLRFQKNDALNLKQNEVDLFVALHACDTATDFALYQGIRSNADLIVTAPCCHKEVRRNLKSQIENPILRHGILKERQCEILTDTLRSLVLEDVGYKSKVFEFISNEHTSKNIMVVGQKNKDDHDQKFNLEKSKSFMLKNGIEEQSLVTLIEKDLP